MDKIIVLRATPFFFLNVSNVTIWFVTFSVLKSMLLVITFQFWIVNSVINVFPDLMIVRANNSPRFWIETACSNRVWCQIDCFVQKVKFNPSITRTRSTTTIIIIELIVHVVWIIFDQVGDWICRIVKSSAWKFQNVVRFKIGAVLFL